MILLCNCTVQLFQQIEKQQESGTSTSSMNMLENVYYLLQALEDMIRVFGAPFLSNPNGMYVPTRRAIKQVPFFRFS